MEFITKVFGDDSLRDLGTIFAFAISTVQRRIRHEPYCVRHKLGDGAKASRVDRP